MKKSILLCALLLSINVSAGNSTPSELQASRYETLDCSTDEQCEKKVTKRIESLEKNIPKLEQAIMKAEKKLALRKEKLAKLKVQLHNLKGE